MARLCSGGERVQVRETHISWLLITTERRFPILEAHRERLLHVAAGPVLAIPPAKVTAVDEHHADALPTAG